MAGSRSEIDAVLLMQCIIYCSLLALELCTIISLETSKTQNGGACFLLTLSNGICTPTSSISQCNTNTSNTCSGSDQISCNFIFGTNGIEAILVAIVSIYHIYIFYKSRWDVEVTHSLRLKVPLVFSFVCSVLSLILGGVGSYGFHRLPDELGDMLARGENITFYQDSGACSIVYNARQLTMSKLEIDLRTTEVCLWLSCVLWITILAITIVRHMQQQRHEKSKWRASELLENSGSGYTAADQHSKNGDEDEVLYETNRTYRT